MEIPNGEPKAGICYVSGIVYSVVSSEWRKKIDLQAQLSVWELSGKMSACLLTFL